MASNSLRNHPTMYFFVMYVIYPNIYVYTGGDISKPLKNSLIHTGHGDPGGKSWGCPEAIDE